jgi:hypothetical protein
MKSSPLAPRYRVAISSRNNVTISHFHDNSTATFPLMDPIAPTHKPDKNLLYLLCSNVRPITEMNHEMTNESAAVAGWVRRSDGVFSVWPK